MRPVLSWLEETLRPSTVPLITAPPPHDLEPSRRFSFPLFCEHRISTVARFPGDNLSSAKAMVESF